MKNYKKLSLFLVLVLVSAVFIGCSNNGANEVPESEGTEDVTDVAQEDTEVVDLVIVDKLGREVTLEKTPERVVAITPSDAEILFAVGAGDTLVGRGTYVDNPEEAMEAPVVASGQEMNAEEIIALEPDLVLMSDMAQTEAQVEALTNAGINVIMTSSEDIAGVYESIEIIGKAMNKEDEAIDVIDEMKSVFAEIEENNEDNHGKTVYFEISPLEYGLWSAGSGTFMNEIAEIVGLENIFPDIEGWSEVSEEDVISRNPDYIITIALSSGEGESPVDEIMARPGWEVITAVENGDILNLVEEELSRPSPRLSEGAKILEDFVNESK